MGPETDDRTANRTDAPVAAGRLAHASMLLPLVTIVLVALVFVLVLRLEAGDGGASGRSAAEELVGGVRDDRYQAVYMANDRVYFGKLTALDEGGLELRDAFFLRQSKGRDAAAAAEAGQEVVSVEVEVGGDGTLLIASEQVVLVQNLKSDSDVTRAIEDALE